MALNKFIHPRNPYRKPPNFKELALKYPDFRNFVIQDLSGKVRYDFKKDGAITVLTKTLLHKDFQLNVEFPPDRLVPTLTLRMNYLLWIEDMLKCFADMDNIHGIDIGTGASCVYPLLAARHFKWKMLATEIDPKSIKFAKNNVIKNNLHHLITVKEVEGDKFLDGVIEDVQYDFCMCNPPFFADDTELDMFSKSRTAERNPPRNSSTGTSGELVASGGEISFVEKIINDSKSLGSKIKLYSVMVGHKRNVSKLKELIDKMNPVRVETGEFCQGRTMRWGLAWTFDKSLLGIKFPGSPKKIATAHDKPPYEWFYPKNDPLEYTLDKLMDILNNLKIDVSVEDEEDMEAILTLTAYENTWSHSRRKRREEKRKARSTPGPEGNTSNPPASVEGSKESNDGQCSTDMETDAIPLMSVEGSKLSNDRNFSADMKNDLNRLTSAEGSQLSNDSEGLNASKESAKRKLPSNNDQINMDSTNKCEDSAVCSSDESSSKKAKIVFLECSLVLMVLESVTAFSLNYLDGPGGREATNQLLQSLKNRFMGDSKPQS